MKDNNIEEVDFDIKENTEETKQNENELSEDEDFVIIEDDEEVSENINAYRKKKRLKLAIISIIVLIVCSAGCYLFITQRAQLDRFDASLHNKKYTEAKELYEKLMDSQKTEADSIILAKVESIYDIYYKGNRTIEKAVAELDDLLMIKSNVKEEINEMKELFALLAESEKDYEKGKEAYEEGKLKNSIVYYGKVIKKDRNYKSAQSALKKISNEYRKEQIKLAQEYVEEDDYDNAIKIMYNYLKLLSNDKVALKKLQEYKSKKLDLNILDIQDNIDVCTKKNDYVEAIKIVKNAMNEYGEDKRLVELLPKLVEKMYEQVEVYIKSKRYTSAVNILKDYLKVVKEDEKAQGLIKKYSNKVTKGVYLSSMEAKQKEGKCYIIKELSEYKDANSNTYEDVLEVVGYRNFDTKGKLVLDNDGYSKLTGTIGYVSSKDIEYYKDGSGKVVIYGDDKEIYTSKDMTLESENENVDINIVNYSKITIEWKPTNPSNIKMYSIVLGDFKFEK